MAASGVGDCSAGAGAGGGGGFEEEAADSPKLPEADTETYTLPRQKASQCGNRAMRSKLADA